MARGDRQLLDSINRMPFIDSAELALILGEAHTTVHRALTGLLADGIVGRVSHGTAHLPSSQRYHLTAQGIGEAAWVLGFEAPSDFVRAYPVSREWLTLLVRRMDAVAAVYRLAATMSPGTDGLRSHVEFHRRGRFDATITLHDGRSFGVVRQGLALRRRSLYDRLRAIAEYDYARRPDTILILAVRETRLASAWGYDGQSSSGESLMSKTYLPYEPDQQLLLPAALQEWLPDDHLAYFISDVVDQLDMSEVTARYERERRGGPPYHPRMMVRWALRLLRGGGVLTPHRPASPRGHRLRVGCWRRTTHRTSGPSPTFARIIWMRCRACSYGTGVVPAGGAGEAGARGAGRHEGQGQRIEA